MFASSNKIYRLNLKGNEAITDSTTKLTYPPEYINLKKYEEELKTSVIEVFDSKNQKGENSDCLENSFLQKKINRTRSEKSDISDSEKEDNNFIYDINNNIINDDDYDYLSNQPNPNEIVDFNNDIDNQNMNRHISIEKSENIQISETDESFRHDNLRKELQKRPMNSVKIVIEGFIKNKKLNLNLDKVFGTSFEQNRAALDLNIYEILCLEKDNKKILEVADEELSGENKEKFRYFLIQKLKFIFEKYINNEKEFVINGKKYIIEEFKTLNDIIEEKREKNIKKKNNNNNIINKNVNTENKKRKTYNTNYSEAKIVKFEEMSKKFLNNIKNGFFDERIKRKKKNVFFIYKTIKKFDDLIEKEND